jgi:hypothetical protein
MTSKQLFETRYKDLPAFAISNFGDVEKFERRLSSVRTQIQDKLQRAQEDAMALANDRLIHPVPTIDCRGYPQWRGSEARELLIDDLKAKKHKEMRPMKLHDSCPQYKDFPLEAFRTRIYKELRKMKKGGRKKHGVRTK